MWFQLEPSFGKSSMEDHPTLRLTKATSCYRRQVAHPAQSNASLEFVALDLGEKGGRWPTKPGTVSN